MKVVISSNPEKLRQYLAEFPLTITIEAEYGEEVVEGTIATLAHHGQRSSQPAPCLGDKLGCPFCGGLGWAIGSGLEGDFPCHSSGQDVVIGVSHFDLDTLGGYMRATGQKGLYSDEEDLFWRVAALVDVRGVHKLEEIRRELESEFQADKLSQEFFLLEWEDVIEELNAFWAWSEENRLFPPRDGSVKDVTDFFTTASYVLISIFEGAPQLIKAGRKWAEGKERLNWRSFSTEKNGVILRSSNEFVNHLYNVPDEKQPEKAVVAFNSKRGSVTISLADPIPGFSCREFVQELWGDKAGGQEVIAGSPRDREMNLGDAIHAFALLTERI